MHINISKVDFGRCYSGGGVEYDSEYLTLSALEDGEIRIDVWVMESAEYATYLSYSKDKSNWTTTTLVSNPVQTIIIPISGGENVYLKGDIRKTYNMWADNSMRINSTANINASGNIMSLVYGDNFKDKIAFPDGTQDILRGVFSDNTHLISAENLILPATTLVNSCYLNMFYGCTSLTTAPKLPAITLAMNCYQQMFNGCTSLTIVPELPATTLADYCYQNMFYGCTSLESAPELPATTLANSCYYNMFYRCSKLNSITMLATDISASDCLTNWVDGVSSTGTFTKAASMTTLPSGTSGIPSGWTVVNK